MSNNKHNTGFTVTCNDCGNTKIIYDEYESYEIDSEGISISSYMGGSIECLKCHQYIDEKLTS